MRIIAERLQECVFFENEVNGKESKGLETELMVKF